MPQDNLIIFLALIGVVLLVKFIHWTIVVHSVNMKLYDRLGEDTVKWLLEENTNPDPEAKPFKINFFSSDLRLAVVTILATFKNIIK